MPKTINKKDGSSSRVTSSPGGQTPSKDIAEGLNDSRGIRAPIWPEWNEAEVSTEKWDASKSKDSKGGKGTYTPLNQLNFEDPEGRVELPLSLKVHSWKRPSEILESPVVVENESTFDLTTANEHLLCSELMRSIISEIYILWRALNGTGGGGSRCGAASGGGGGGTNEDRPVSMETTPGPWRPWEHIYSLGRVAKGQPPLYNPYGKYILKLYWMGAWRKVTIDDALPLDEDNKLLLPVSTARSELWPMLLAKALIKLANTDAIPGHRRELGEFTIIHTLTGWVPEIIPLNGTRCLGSLWSFLREAIPRFHPRKEKEKEGEASISPSLTAIHTRSPDKRRDSLKRKAGQEDRKHESPVTSTCQASSADTSEDLVVCASYLPLQLLEKKTSELGKLADSSECLRQCGLSQLFSHPVLLTRTRVGPLVTPPSPPPIPRWKLIRPRKQHHPTDEPKEPPVAKPEDYIEVASPFINFRLKTSVDSMPGEAPVPSSRRRQTGFNSVLGSFTEQEESERQVVTENPEPEPVEMLEPTEVTAEDKRKDERPPSDEASNASPDAKIPSPVCVAEKPVLQETWVPLENFTQCFQTLLVFHKSSAYPHQAMKSQFKSSICPRLSASDLLSPNAQCPEEKASYFLVVDSLQPSEILISFSALVHWGDTLEEKKEQRVRSGVLTVEPFSWKSLQCQLPILTTHSSACKAVILKLEPGRRVFRIHLRAVLGFHVHLFSQTPIVFGDEESVLPALTKESVCFEEQALCVLRAMAQVVGCFSSEAGQQAALRALSHTHFPPDAPRTAAGQHMKVFGEAVQVMFSKALERRLSPEELLAVRALTLQPGCGGGEAGGEGGGGGGGGGSPYRTPSQHRTDSPATAAAEAGMWAARCPPTEAETQAATTLQAGLRGYAARKVVAAARPGTKENESAAKTLQEMWASVETDLKKHAISLLGYMFSESPGCAELYSCRQAEESHISLLEHYVALPDTPHTWALIYREVFMVPKDTLLVAKVFSPVPSVLHVIDNDTGEQVPKVFRRVQPHVYKKNQNGYTFVAETHTSDAPNGRWRLNLIGSRQPLPVPLRDPASNSFCVKEFKDYYIPNDKHIICRFCVSVGMDAMCTVQFQASLLQVQLRLTVLDHNTPLATATGRGQALIPVFTFRTDAGLLRREGIQKNSDSQKTSANTPDTDDGLGEEGSIAEEHSQAEEEEESMDTHKYMLQVEVLHRSWPITETEATFIESRRLAERNELRVAVDKLDEMSAEQATSDGQKSTTPKSGRKAKEKEKEKEKEKPAAKPGSKIDQLDMSMPHWMLRVVCDQSEAENVCVKRDTERQEQIRALKMAWESAEPGRAVKALQSRLQFINKRLRGLTGDAPPTDGTERERRESSALSNSQSPDGAASPQIDMSLIHAVVPPMDYTPYIRRSGAGPPVLKDESVCERQRVCRSERLQEWRLQRDMVLQRRLVESSARRALKRRQLEQYDNIQVALSVYRRPVLEAREALLQQKGSQDQLDAEGLRCEEELATEAPKPAQDADKRKNASGKKK
ncbi:androglobin isoform X2 [Engraulis encrasicolus]|uniref:androglobin isoform X2 n=1 Tax=Engraulis encrasicolus TaxID=184585 RepID=UPI002FD4F48D